MVARQAAMQHVSKSILQLSTHGVSVGAPADLSLQHSIELCIRCCLLADAGSSVSCSLHQMHQQCSHSIECTTRPTTQHKSVAPHPTAAHAGLTSEGAAAGLALQLAEDACLGVLSLACQGAGLVALLVLVGHWGQGLASDGVLGGLGD
jgi:hypothetical protein